MSTPVFNNGIFLREMAYDLNSRFIDEYHVAKIMGDSQPTDLGPVSIWAMARYPEVPLYNLAIVNRKNWITVTDPQGRYSWEFVVNYELPQIVEDVQPNNTQKGKNGTTFLLKFNKPGFGPGVIITCDLFAGPEVRVLDAGVEVDGAWIYKCELASNLNSDAYVDNIFIQPGTVWFKKTSAYNSWSTQFQGLDYKSGLRQYYNYCPSHQVGIEKHITEEALNKIMMGGGEGKAMNFVEMIQIADPKFYDPSVRTINDLLVKTGGEKGLRKAIKEGRVNMMLLNKIEADMLRTLALDIENELMWGKGGIINGENNSFIRRTPGLWSQFNLGYKTVYTKSTFSLKLIEDVIYNFFVGREPFEPNDPSRIVRIQTGLGGMKLASAAIQASAAATGLAIAAAGANSINAITGSRMDLEFGFRYSGYIIPNLAKVYFEYNPALDNWNANEVSNPMIDGFRLSSYSFLIYDIGGSAADNIRFLKYYASEGPKWIYRNGTCDYKGSSVVQSAGNFSGYYLNIRQYVPGIHVMDPTKIAKIVMRNPITGDTL